MATWTPRNAMRGIAVSPWGRPPPPPYLSPEYPSSETLPSTPPDSDLDDEGASSSSSSSSTYPVESDMPIPISPYEEPEVDDWLEQQLATTGEMSVVERLQYLLDTGQFADVNIRVGQGNNVTVFKAHRLILATASQPLYRLVYTVNPSPSPNDVTTVRVTDMKPTDFEHILKYIYTDTIDCSNINVAFELLRASKKWGLAGLGIKSLNYLEEFLDEYEPSSDDMKTNLFDLLVLSEQSLCDMYEKCLKVLAKHCNDVIPCEGFLKLEKPVVCKVLHYKDLKFSDHLRLFEAIRDWGLRYINIKNLKMSQLGDVVEELIKIVDFEKIEDNDFVTTVLTSECLGKAEVIAFFMTRGLEIPRNLDFNNNKQLPFWIWFCATSETEGKSKKGSKRKSGNLSTVPESSPTISLKNGTVLAFQKVCRFRKGYRCPQEQIYLPHELRFRVSKNIKLIGVGFGFLFSCTDMGITIHCQGPWETRQWTDIIQTYCRVSGEKQETADVRLMFSEPVRIEANHSYKVMVKIGRMSSGSSDVELWGGTGAQYTVATEELDFYFIKAAVDPNTKVEERDGDTNPGIITELLYQIDTEDYSKEDAKTEVVTRRRRPKEEEEEDESQQTSNETSPWRKRHRAANMSLQTSEVTRIRRRGDGSDSISYTPKKSPVEEYKPMSFSTNRWRTRTRDEESDSSKTTPVEEYKPSSFSTNRWRTRTKDEDAEKEEYKPSSFSTNRWRSKPQEEPSKPVEDSRPTSFSTNRWRTRTQEDSSSTVAKSNEETQPPGFLTNRWRNRSRDEDSNKSTSDTPFGTRKVSTEDKTDVNSTTNRWRTRSREEPPQTKVELRKTIGVDDDKKFLPFLRRRESTENKPAELPFMRRRESTENKVPEMPAYLRKRSNPIEDNKAATPFGRSRWGSSITSTTSNDDSKSSTTTKSRFLQSSDISSKSSQPSDLYRTRDTSTPRYSSSRELPSASTLSRPSDSVIGRTRESSVSLTRAPSLSRFRDSSSTSRFGPSSTSSYGSSYLSRYDSPSAGDTGNSGLSDSSPTSISSRYNSSTSSGNTPRRYLGAGSDSTLYRTRTGSSLGTGGTNPSASDRYGSTSSSRYTPLGTSSGLKDSGSSRFSISGSSRPNDSGTSSTYSPSGLRGASDSSPSSRYSTSVSKGATDASSSSRYAPLLSKGVTDAASSSRYGTSVSKGATDGFSSSRFGRYSSPVNTRGADSTSKSMGSRYGASVLSPTPSTTYSGSNSSKLSAVSGAGRYGNDSPTGKYGTTANKYSTMSSRY
ncbi:LOW QUALITY PROTEIN: serine-rich adhesin for platelets-like [Macrobrachium rosenbergii]|uniref:LOW QUALITY PROTEIN: serine-rich adhesin for platelets-like n=1 Tax=Macrobrachium rosenbergii TaxID=79674 RepID=UPI0034D51DAE